MDWELRIKFYWPHHSFKVGWDILHADDVYNYTTIKLHLFIVSIDFDYQTF